jgi:uncharacterized protein YfaS (alpha-2-macroglobulin family)
VSAWLCCLLGVACSAKSSVPELPPSGTIAPRSRDTASPTLSVVYAGPRGAAARGSTVSLLFDRPLRELDAAVPPPAISIQPVVVGEWQWTGARGLNFVPAAGRLPAATAFRVVVPVATTALDGSQLAAPYELAFETPAPHVLSTVPEAGATAQEPDARITLEFDQAVPATAIERAGRLLAHRASRQDVIAFSARSRPGSPERIDVVARRPLPLGASIEFVLPAGVRGSEGPRPTLEAWSLRFDTYGPLRVINVNCNVDASVGRCDPEGAIWVELSNPAPLRQLASHVSIEPPIELRWPDDLDEQSRYVYLPVSGRLAPATSYRVSVSAGVVDGHGQKLAAPRTVTLSTANFAPRVELPVSGEVFVPPLTELGLVSRNALELRAFSRRLDADGLLELYAAQSDYEKNRELLARFATAGVVVPGALDNQVHIFPIALGPVLGAGAERGAAWIGWRWAGSAVTGQVVQVTDLGLTAKLSDQGSLVWVTRLDSGAPVAGATVELVGHTPKLARRYLTDAAGLVEIPKEDFAPRFSDYGSDDDTILIARHAGDSSFRRVADFLPPWRIDVPMRLSVSEKEYGLLFSERGIYRPGEVVRVKGIVRREAQAGNTLIVGRKLTLELSDPFGEVAGTQGVETSRFGTFSADVQVPGSAALGQWRLMAQGFPDDALTIQVAEYRPAEFRVAVEPGAPAYRAGESARFHVRADYLFGSPMSGMGLAFGVTRERAFYSPPGAEGYATGEDAYRRDLPSAALDSSVLAHTEAALSASGEYDASVPLVLPGQTGPERVRLDASVTDVSRQVIASSAAVLVHPASHYLGLALDGGWFRPVSSTIDPRVLGLTPLGDKRPGRPVQLELVRRRWTLVREKTEDGWRTNSQPVDEVQGTCSVVTAAEPVSCPLELRESGQFFVRASSPDEQGRVARAAIELYAIGAGRASWPDNDQRKLELVLDKPEYRMGDTARVLIKNPFLRAEALLTLERAGLYEHRRLTLEGPTPTVDIPIDDRFRPNAFVSVHLVQGVASSAPPSASSAGTDVTPEPGYRIGYAELRVDPEARRLGVQVTSESHEYQPGQRVRFDLRVTRVGSTPHPAELTVYAVDEGVLSLTNYQPPDPVASFTAPRPLAVATLESRDALGRLLLPGLERDKGMDGGGGGALGIRSNFRTTAFFDPKVETDAEGRASVEFELPDNLTTFRLMAVAVSDDDRYGVGSTTFSVNKPLMMRPALPRVLRVGDRFEAAVAINTRLDAPADVTVGLALEGATLEGPATQKLRIEKGVSREARFSVVSAQPGEARFDFTASASMASDRVRTTRSVKSPTALETTALYGRTEQAEVQALGDVRELRSDVGGLTIALASTALVGLDASLGQLVDYPYACTEQLASGILPLAPLRGLSERQGLALPADVDKALELRVGEILARQHGEGGFGLWPDSPEVQPWVSAYALWVLDQAKRAGARVPTHNLELGIAYLRQWLALPRATPSDWATAALMADTLAALGQADIEYTTQLFEGRKNLPDFARALLLHAAVTGKSDPALIETLASELEAQLSVHGNVAQLSEPEPERLHDVFDSEARSEALVLWALLAKNPHHPLAEPLARGVLARRAAGRWRSTQESAYALLALDAYGRAVEAARPRFEAAVYFGEQRLFQASFAEPFATAKTHSVGMAELAALPRRLTFEKQGVGTLYYEARLAYAPARLPEQPLERGFSLEKSARAVTPSSLPAALAASFDPRLLSSTFAGGDLVLVDVVVAAPTGRHFVVLDDPLPAGLEAVDASLATSSPALEVGQSSDADDASGFSSSWYRRELRDDRVLFFVDDMPAGIYRYRYLARATALGRFIVPPTQVSEMYQPEVFGRTGASVVEIR